MDYKLFYDDVLVWIGKANQAAFKYGLDDQTFWMWVSSSIGAMCKKYNDNRLVILQMTMMVEWLEEKWQAQKYGG
jgi:hypothetical protein